MRKRSCFESYGNGSGQKQIRRMEDRCNNNNNNIEAFTSASCPINSFTTRSFPPDDVACKLKGKDGIYKLPA